jgi:hypothetical protein
MVMSPSNLQDQQSIGILSDIPKVEAFQDKTIVMTTDYQTKNVQLDLARDKNEVWLNANAILVT